MGAATLQENGGWPEAFQNKPCPHFFIFLISQWLTDGIFTFPLKTLHLPPLGVFLLFPFTKWGCFLCRKSLFLSPEFRNNHCLRDLLEWFVTKWQHSCMGPSGARPLKGHQFSSKLDQITRPEETHPMDSAERENSLLGDIWRSKENKTPDYGDGTYTKKENNTDEGGGS